MPSESRKPHKKRLENKKRYIDEARQKIDKIAEANASYALTMESGYRPSGMKKSAEKILIVCEGEQTEPNYFNWLKTRWKLHTASLIIIAGAGDPLNIVQRAITEKNKKTSKFDQVWAVFDRDDFDINRLQQAFSQARNNNIKIAFSNECFELWYLLHFKFRNTSITRKELCDELSKLLKKPYKKNDTSFYQEINDKMRDAIKHANSLCTSKKDENYIKSNPYTNIHVILKELSKQSAKLPTIIEEIDYIFS